MNSKKFRLDTGNIISFTQDGLSTADGNNQLQHHHLDVIIFATGFSLADNWAMLTGKNGSIESFYGCFYENTPNFFLFYGPHANLGHFSIIFMIECQMNMLVNILKTYFEAGANVCLGRDYCLYLQLTLSIPDLEVQKLISPR